MKQIIFAAAFLGAVVFGNIASAQSRRPVRDTRDDRQVDVRVNHGVRNGTLTAREARQLRMQQANYERMERMAMADGYISPRERVMLREEKQKMNYQVYAQKHDRQNRW